MASRDRETRTRHSSGTRVPRARRGSRIEPPAAGHRRDPDMIDNGGVYRRNVFRSLRWFRAGRGGRGGEGCSARARAVYLSLFLSFSSATSTTTTMTNRTVVAAESEGRASSLRASDPPRFGLTRLDPTRSRAVIHARILSCRT